MMLLAVDLDEDLIDEKCVTVATMFALQPSTVYCPRFYTPQASRLAADSNTSLSEQTLDVSMTEVKA
jgi:hypothetical protein